MIKVLFVCLGNICRSPMAEFVMKQMVTEKGVGLGLTIVRDSVLAHGGTIRLETSPQKGLRVLITLPEKIKKASFFVIAIETKQSHQIAMSPLAPRNDTLQKYPPYTIREGGWFKNSLIILVAQEI